ncbi:MAG TPA: hypothetical protein VIS49_13785 [Cyclobacteriaceae bacterium]
MKLLIGSAFIAVTSVSCNQRAQSQGGGAGLYETTPFKEYWYAGKAELNAYTLVQSRYGEQRSGKAMLIFVTEPFSKSKQVKLDNPEATAGDKVTVMKLNYTKNFVTGIYPYSMMLSVFTPVSRNQYPHSLKVTMTSQEWCGHVFSQMNLKGNRYDVSSYSYFEKEGDVKFTVDKILLEDELFNMIRVDPENVPQGQIRILPGLFFTRMKHENLNPIEAKLSKTETESETTYSIKFPSRLLTIHVAKSFPHQILGWVEELKEGENIMLTKATLDKTLVTDYWRKHNNEHLPLRDSLGLSPNNY